MIGCPRKRRFTKDQILRTKRGSVFGIPSGPVVIVRSRSLVFGHYLKKSNVFLERKENSPIVKKKPENLDERDNILKKHPQSPASNLFLRARLIVPTQY